MMQQAGQGGKAVAPQGKQGAPQGKQGAPQGGAQGKQGAQGGPPQAGGQGGGPNLLSMLAGVLPSAAGHVEAGATQRPVQPATSTDSPSPNASATFKRDFPMFSPMAQGFQGASAAQQNPNEGGASSSPSALTSPSTSQGGMG